MPGVPLERLRAHFWTFGGCFVATLIFYTIVHVVHAESPSWLATPTLIIGDTTRAAAFWLLGSPVAVEGIVMVFAALYREKKREEARLEGRHEGRQEGREEGISEAHAAWGEWNRRRMEAEANGEPFAEPPPDFANGPGGT